MSNGTSLFPIQQAFECFGEMGTEISAWTWSIINWTILIKTKYSSSKTWFTVDKLIKSYHILISKIRYTYTKQDTESKLRYGDTIVFPVLGSTFCVAWTWAAYCKFQRTSSKEGRVDDSGEMQLIVKDIAMESDSCEQDASTIGSTTRLCPSGFPRETCKLHKAVTKITKLSYQ